MTVEEMVFDAGIYLGFFFFGLMSGVFIMWMEERHGDARS